MATVLVFLNLFGVLLQRGAVLFLRDTGRKLQHLDRQLGTADAVLDDLRDQLKR